MTCDNHVYIQKKIELVCDKQHEIEERVHALEMADTKQTEQLVTIFKSLAKIEALLEAITKREDPFKKAMFDVGIWSIKVLLFAGSLIWLSDKVG